MAVFFFLWPAIAFRHLVPFWDGVWVYNYLDGAALGRKPDLLSSDLFSFVDNEHRPFFPMFVWKADYEWFNATGLMPLLLSYVFIAGSALLATSGVLSQVSWTSRFAIGAAALAIAFAPMHYYNLMWEKQVHVAMSLLMSLAALWMAGYRAGRAEKSGELVAVALAGAFGFVASFSFAYGMVVWPVLFAHALLIGWRWRGLATLAFFAASAVALYFSVWTPNPQHGNPLDTLRDPTGIYRYVAHFMAGPVSAVLRHAPWYSQDVETVIGSAIVAALVFAGLGTYLLRRSGGPGRQFGVMLVAYCLGIGSITALGRLTMNGDADVSRYLIVPVLALLALPSLLWANGATTREALESRLVVFGLLLISLSFGSAPANIPEYRGVNTIVVRSALAAEFKVSETVHGLFPDKRLVDNVFWPSYRKKQNEIGRLLPFSWLGKPLAGRVEMDGSCPGHIDGLKAVKDHPGVFITDGWARYGELGKYVPEWVVAVNDKGVVVGLGKTLLERKDVAAFLGQLSQGIHFREAATAGIVGYLRGSPGDALNFYALHGSKACRFFSTAIPA
ncbi:MAG: hypothetical protein KDJ90_14010 [Nitratireductor sp.]|nr:hypothetical protein [Nitratireductor sp.]